MKNILLFIAALSLLTACGKYESQDPLVAEMKMRGGHFMQIAVRMEAAEELMVEGQGLILQGRKEVAQGQNLLADGENHQKQGNGMFQQGERMKYEAELKYRQVNAQGF